MLSKSTKNFIFLLSFGVFSSFAACTRDEPTTSNSANQQNQTITESKQAVNETVAAPDDDGDCNKPTTGDEGLLCKAIIKTFEVDDAYMLETMTIMNARVDLNDDGHEEVVVWISGNGWGGTGGYPLVIFSRGKNGYKELGSFEMTWTPIVLLKTKKNGWHDIAYQEGGGGVDFHDIVISHNGKKYDINKRYRKPRDGKVIIDKTWKSSILGPMVVK